MSVIQASMSERPRTLLIAAGYAGLVGAASVALGIVGALDGETPAIGQALLGLVGVAASALLLTNPRQGWLLALVWAAVQIPYIAWNVDGSPLVQLLSFPLSSSSETRVNGEITSFSEYGINLIGVALTIVAHRWRGEFERQSS
jgi:hypothetical protein